MLAERLETLLMDGVGIGVQETDGNDGATLLLQVLQEGNTGGLIQRLVYGSHMRQAFRNLINVLRGYQARWFHPEIHVRTFRYVMAPNVEHVAASSRRQQGHGRALALDNHIRRDR